MPNVWHIRDWFLEFPLFWKVYSRYIHAFSDRGFVAVSDRSQASSPRSYGAKVVHDGFELEEFALSDPDAGAKFRAEYGLGDAPVVGCVGRIKLDPQRPGGAAARGGAAEAARGVRAQVYRGRALSGQ